MTLRSFHRNLKSFSKNFAYYKNVNHNMFAFRYLIGKNIMKNRLTSPPFLIFRSMAGHAKWQNIKFVKAEKDREKNFIRTKYSRLITLAVKEKGADPKSNNKLALLLEEAKRNNVPGSTIENALKKKPKKTKPGTIEILGPGSCLIIVDYETDNVGDMRHGIKVLCKKYSSNLLPGEGGRWRAAYEQKGIVKVISHLNGEDINQETAVDAAIEAGAEDVKNVKDESDKVLYEFLCAPDDLHAVKKVIESKFAVEEAYVGYLPISTVLLEDDDLALADKFLDELSNLPDICRIHENIE